MKKMKENGAGILMSTHILATAERYCDRFIILHEGKVRAHGTMDQLRKEFGMPKATLDDLIYSTDKGRTTMFDEKLLWKERLSRTSKELSRYLRYIFNGHLVIVFMFLLGTAAYYYQEWLKTLPETFPSAIIMSVCMSILLTYSPIYTFMSEADRIFLLPLETKLGGYFRKSILISFSCASLFTTNRFSSINADVCSQ